MFDKIRFGPSESGLQKPPGGDMCPCGCCCPCGYDNGYMSAGMSIFLNDLIGSFDVDIRRA